jgi:uncharacterized protein (DUF433 family)
VAKGRVSSEVIGGLQGEKSLKICVLVSCDLEAKSNEMKYGPVSIEEGEMKGTPLFDGTDVPVKAFFEYLEDEKSVSKFLNDYPAVNKKDAIEVLQIAKVALTNEKFLKEHFFA